jgi:stage III sporulation protein AG
MKELRRIVESLKERGKTLVQAFGWTRLAIVTAAVLALIFLSLPKRSASDADTEKTEQTQTDTATGDSEEDLDTEQAYAKQMETQLEQLLEQVEGVGSVEVMITLKSSSQTVLNKDVEQSESSRQDAADESRAAGGEQETSYQEETVLVEDSDGNQTPTVIKKLKPEVAGVLVICEGGGNPQVVSDITSAAEVLFSVSAHKVKVMKKGS